VQKKEKKLARILITEDERLIAEDLKLTLQAHGHEIIGIEFTGEGAVERTRELSPDIIFMDIRLKGDMSGIDAARKIRQISETAIIFCTAYSDDHTLLKISSLSPEGYIAKPFHEKEIKSIFKNLSESKKGRNINFRNLDYQSSSVALSSAGL